MAHRITVNFYDKNNVSTDSLGCEQVAILFLEWLLDAKNHLEEINKDLPNREFYDFNNTRYYNVVKNKSEIAIFDQEDLFTQSNWNYSTCIGITNYLATKATKTRNGYEGVVCLSDLDDSRFKVSR